MVGEREAVMGDRVMAAEFHGEIGKSRVVVEVLERGGKFDVRIARRYDSDGEAFKTSLLRVDEDSVLATFGALSKAWRYVEARRAMAREGCGMDRALAGVRVPEWMSRFLVMA